MKIKNDSVFIGLPLGIIAPMIAFYLYYYFNYKGLTYSEFVHNMDVGGIYAPVLSICVLVNLGVFFGFIWADKDRSAKGVLLATFLYAGLVCYIKFFA